MRLPALVAILAMFVCGAWLGAVQDKTDPGVRALMLPKLEHAQELLEGLALEDYKLIVESGRQLLKISEAAEWRVLPDIDYVRYSGDFQATTNKLIQAANEKDLDAATLAYMKLAMNCVECHKHVRQVRRVSSLP